MLIGLDFDNTLACYDNVFSAEAKKKGLVGNHWEGTKKDLKNKLLTSNNGCIYGKQFKAKFMVRVCTKQFYFLVFLVFYCDVSFKVIQYLLSVIKLNTGILIQPRHL